jgi:dTDP-4-amino-4,6-dideoxygalactose transaminase
MDRLVEIGEKHNLFIIEDACHSWGGKWKGKGTGALGHCGVFSFQASKNINSGEGGIMLTDDEEIAEAARSFTNCGRRERDAWYSHFVMGSNLRLTEFEAAILLGQLTRLEAQTLKRQANARILNDGLRDLPGIIVIEDDPRITRRAYHLYTFRVDSDRLGISRERFVEALSAEGVPVGPGYPTPLYKNPLFQRSGDGPDYCPVSCPYYGKKIDYATVSCPVCEQICADTCWIPHRILLAEEPEILGIVAAVRKVVEHVEELR